MKKKAIKCECLDCVKMAVADLQWSIRTTEVNTYSFCRGHVNLLMKSLLPLAGKNLATFRVGGVGAIER